MELTEADGITKILDLYAPEHLPIGIPVKKNTVDKKALNMCGQTALFLQAVPVCRKH